MTNEEVKEILSSANISELAELNNDDFVDYMVNTVKIFSSEKDLKYAVINFLADHMGDEDMDWPIKYYEEDEEIPDYEDVDLGDMLTDDFIKQINE